METSCDDKVLPYLTNMKYPFLCVRIARQFLIGCLRHQSWVRVTRVGVSLAVRTFNMTTFLLRNTPQIEYQSRSRNLRGSSWSPVFSHVYFVLDFKCPCRAVCSSLCFVL